MLQSGHRREPTVAGERGPFPPRPGVQPDAAQLAALALRLDGAVATVATVEAWMAAAGEQAEALPGMNTAFGALTQAVRTLSEEVRAIGRAMEKEPEGPSLDSQLSTLTKAVNRNSDTLERLVVALAKSKVLDPSQPPAGG